MRASCVALLVLSTSYVYEYRSCGREGGKGVRENSDLLVKKTQRPAEIPIFEALQQLEIDRDDISGPDALYRDLDPPGRGPWLSTNPHVGSQAPGPAAVVGWLAATQVRVLS